MMSNDRPDPFEIFERNEGAEEREWITAIRDGDKDAFRKVFETWYNPLLRFAFRYVQSETISEGLVQELFLWIWENRKSWNVEGNLKTYLFRAIKYKAMDYWRHQRTREKYLKKLSRMDDTGGEPIGDPGRSNESEESEFIRVAQRAIEELPERSRMIYKLNRLEGLTYSEIADILDISPKTVESHMSRGLSYLRKRLSKYLAMLLILI